MVGYLVIVDSVEEFDPCRWVYMYVDSVIDYGVAVIVAERFNGINSAHSGVNVRNDVWRCGKRVSIRIMDY